MTLRLAALVAGLALGLMSGTAQAADVDYGDFNNFLDLSGYVGYGKRSLPFALHLEDSASSNLTFTVDTGKFRNPLTGKYQENDVQIDAISVPNTIPPREEVYIQRPVLTYYGKSGSYFDYRYGIAFDAHLDTEQAVQVFGKPSCYCEYPIGVNDLYSYDLHVNLLFDLQSKAEISRFPDFQPKLNTIKYTTNLIGELQVDDLTYEASHPDSNSSSGPSLYNQPSFQFYLTQPYLTSLYSIAPNYIDESVISPVPLPSSGPMFGAALVALGAVGYGLKRRGKAAAAA